MGHGDDDRGSGGAAASAGLMLGVAMGLVLNCSNRGRCQPDAVPGSGSSLGSGGKVCMLL